MNSILNKKTAIRALLALSIVSIVCLPILSKLRFDYDFENFFPKNDEDLSFFLDHRARFETDNDFLLIGIENSPSIFEKDFLNELDKLSDSLAKLPFIESVASPTNIFYPISTPIGFTKVNYLHPKKPENYVQDSIKISKTKDLIGTFFSEDFKHVSINIRTTENLSKNKSDQLIEGLYKLLEKFDFQAIHIAGKVHGQYHYIKNIKKEMLIFMSSSLVLLIIFLAISFRSFSGVWVPITVVILSAVWLLAFITIIGKALSLMTILLPSILFVVGVSDVVHILERYLEELRNGIEKLKAIKLAFREVGLATFLTSLTTAIGFLTLLTSAVQPLRDFGIYTAIGVFLAFILAFTLLPSILILIPKPKISQQNNQNLFWTKRLKKLFLFVLKNPIKIGIGSLMLLSFSFWGISQIKINNYLLEDLADNNPVKQDFFYFENNFSGVRPFEMAMEVGEKSNSLFELASLKEMEKLEHYLKEKYEVGFVFSPLAVVKGINKSLNGGLEKFNKLPDSKSEMNKILKLLNRNKKNTNLKTIITLDQKKGRLKAKQVDDGSFIIKQKNKDLQKFINENINQDLIKYRITGMAFMIDKNNDTLAKDMLLGLLIAFGVIAIIMGILFASFRMIFISLIPNMLPLLMVAGIIGWTGINLNVSNSIFFTIAFGIAVDDTIHFMSKLKLELGKGKSLLYALKRTYISTGKAITITTIILCSGFLSLVFSTFTSIYSMGILVSITLVFALLADLLVLPVLLLMFYQKKKAK